MNKLRNRLIIIAAIVSLGIIGILAFKYIAPFGKIISYRFSQRLPGSKEANRIEGENESIKLSSQIIKNSISRFTLKIDPKNIENIRVALKFKPGQKEIKIGIRSNEKDTFYYQPLYFSLLRDLNWSNIQEKRLTLWQRNKDFISVEKFIEKTPENRKIALYMVNPDKLLSIKPIKEKGKTQTIIPNPLRGNHSLYIMVTQKPLEIKIAKQDMNMYDGPDKLKIMLSKGQKIITEKTIEDDGITDKSRLQSLPQEEEIKIDEALPGIYKLNLNFESVGADSSTTKIEINQKKVVFNNYLFPLGEKPTTIFTNSSKIDISTPHEAYLQTVLLNNGEKLEIKEVAKKFNFDLGKLAGELKEDELYKLESPKNDLNISGGGYFSFSRESFFYPEIIKTIDIASFDNQLQIYDGIDYILTSLPPLKNEGDWLVSEAIIDPKDIGVDGDTLYFSLEIPDLDKYGGSLEIDSLEVAIKNKGVLEKKESISPAPTTSSENNEGSRQMGLVEKIGKFEVGLFKRIKEFFIGTFGKIRLPFISKTESPTPTPTASFKPTPTPTKTITPTPIGKLTPTPSLKPTATPTIVKQTISILVKVLNGGAEKGMAGKFADTLKAAGFTNVSAGNADKATYANAIVQYRNSDKSIVDKIIDLLKNDYKTIERKEISTSSAEIIVILGKK